MEKEHPPHPDIEIVPENPNAPLTLRTRRRELIAHILTDAELDQISSVALAFAVNLTFFGIGIGGAISFLIAAQTPGIDKGTSGSYWATFAFALVFAIYSGIQSIVAYRGRMAQLNSIRQRGQRGA